MVTGQKVRWVLDLIRGTEFAGRARSRRTRSPTHADRARDRAARGRARRRRAATSPSCASSSSRSATRGRHDAPAPPRRAAAPRAVRHRRDRGLRLVVLHARPTATAPPRGHRSTADGNDARQRAPARRGRRRRPARTRSRPTDGLRVAGLGRLVDGGDGGDTYNYSPPAADRVVDPPDAVRVTTARSAARCAPACRSTPTTRGPRARSATSARARARSDETVRGHGHARRSSSAPASASSASRTSSTTALATTACARTSRCPARVDRLRRRVRVRGRAPRAHRRRRRARARPADVPVAPLRRRVRRHRRPRAPARRPARVRGRRRRRASSRSRCCASVGYLSRSEPSLRPNPAGPTDPGRRARNCPGAQRAEYAVLLHRGDWRAADCYARGRRVPRARSSGRARPARHRRAGPRAARALRVDGAEVSAVLRSPGGLIVRVFRTDARRRAGHASSTTARPPAAGSSTCRAARSRPSTATSSSAPGRSAPSNSPHPRTGVSARRHVAADSRRFGQG